MTLAQFRRMAQILRRKANLPPGVRIKWVLCDQVAGQGFDGMCDDHDTRTKFTIQVADHLSPNDAYWIIAHELAHVRQTIYWPDETDDHGPGYWHEHGFIYRRIVREPEPK